MTLEADSYIQNIKSHFEQYFEQLLPSASCSPNTLIQAIRYSCLNGGKRIRPLMVYLAAEFLDIPANKVNQIAASIELIHCYSMIHDDMPSMDDDDMRRGKPSLHIAHGEGVALLAGDTIQSLAFEVLSSNKEVPLPVIAQHTQILAKACGWQGMAGGQMLDLQATNQNISLEELNTIHAKKTGALILATVQMVAVIDDKNQEKKAALIKFAETIGLAFQIQDDILDVEGTTEQLGKPAQSDIKNHKNTYCALLGMQEAKNTVTQMLSETLEYINKWPDKNHYLISYANFLINRKH